MGCEREVDPGCLWVMAMSVTGLLARGRKVNGGMRVEVRAGSGSARLALLRGQLVALVAGNGRWSWRLVVDGGNSGSLVGLDGWRLDPDDVWAIANAVVALLASNDLTASARRWMSAGEVATAFGCSPEWVRDHAAELGGRKIGGPRAPWRFPASCVEHVVETPEPALRTRTRTRRSRSSVTLLPIRN